VGYRDGEGTEDVAMVKFDHLTIPVVNWAVSRDWYVENLGLTVEFEIPEAKTAAVQDRHEFTVFLTEGAVPAIPAVFALYFQVSDVRQTYELLADRGIPFHHPPAKVSWGFGAELSDPNGYSIRLWDERSMKDEG